MADEQKTYVPHEWTTGEPITQGRMRNIEYGIADAYTMANNAETVAKAASNKVDSCETSINTIGVAVGNIQQQNEQTVTNAQQGAAAWTQILKVINYDAEHETVITDLGQKWETVINTSTELISARKGKDNLRLKIDDMDSNILVIRSIMGETFTTENTIAQVVGSIQGSITTMQEDYASARGYQTDLSRRLNLIDGNPALVAVERYNEIIAAGGRLGIIESELRAAHKQTGENVYAYANINARFNEIENNIGGLTSNTLNKNTDVVNDLISVNTDKALSANMGKTLKDTIGGAYSPANTVATGITNAANAAEANAKNYTDALLGNGFDSTNTVTAAMTQLTTTVSDLDTNVDGRLDTVEQILSDALVSTVVRTPGAEEGDPDTDTTYNSLDARLEAIESHTTAARTDLNTIAAELAMLDNQNAIKDTNTKIDDLVADVHALASEIAMGQDENGRLTGAETRIDDLEERLDTVDGENGTLASLDSRLDTAEDDIDTLQSDLNTAGTGLKDRMTAVESTANAAATATDLTALAGRVTTLENEPKSATVIIENVTYNNDGVPTSIANPSTDVDYLLKKDDKYYYWKYIKTNSNPDIYEWALISGSGSGNSSGFVYTAAEYAELDSVEENTDYYVLESDGYHHYRYVGANEIEIGTSKKYNAYIETIDNEGTSVHYFNLYEFNQNEDDTVTEDNLEALYNNGKRKVHLLLPATGGGGGVINNMKILPVTPRNTSMAFNSSIPTQIRFFFTTGEANEPASYNFTVDGTTILNLPQAIISGDPTNKSYSWPVDENDNELSEQAAAALGFYAIDISNYCNTVGTHTVRITVALDSNSAITVDQTWTVTTFNLSIASNFTNNPIYTQGENISFTYIPSGNVEKVAHFKLDGTEIGTATLSAKTNTEQRYTISSPATAGAHKLEVYLIANNGATKSSSIYRDIIWQDVNNSDIIIASPYRGDTNIKLTQYELLTIPYTIVGGNNRYTVEYFVDDMEHSVNEVSLVNTNAGQWNYRADTDGAHTLRIKCGNTYITFSVNVQESLYDIAPVDSPAPIIDFNPSGITNTSSRRLWTNGNYSLSVSDNFDWYNGGYGTDVNGDYFLVKAGTRAIFNYKMFKGYSKTVDEAITTASTVFRDGQEMKIIFKTSAVRSADAVWFTNIAPTNDTSAAKDVGIQLNVHNGWLKTDSAQDSTKSYLYFPYSEEDRIELDININPDTAPNAVYIMSYEDGCPSRAYPYKTTEALYQHSGSEAPITIGSDDCDVYIYRLRIYDSALDTEQVLRNFIADGKDVTEKLERYSRNSIYYDTQTEEFTPYTGPDTILDPERLAQKIPDVKILMLEAPRFTTEKKDFVANSSLRCIHAPGGKIYPSRGKEDNWFFGNGYHSGQGTTSDKYGDAGRNVDFLFNCDGIHNPSDKVTPGKGFIEGYQSYVIKGYGTDEEEEPEYCSDWKGDDCKVSLTSTSIPNNFFNLKVNIASSENVNNALFQKRFNDFLKDIYETPAYKRDNRIKNDMEFVPAILFIRETDTTHTEETVENKQVINYTNHKEFNDTEWHFYALGNIGDSKKTDYTRAYDPTDMNEFTLEISDNNTNNSQFQTGVYMKNGVRTIEGYTVEQDYDEEKQKYKDTYSAVSSENDITVLTTDYLFPIDRATEWEAVDGNNQPINMRYWGLMNEKFDGDHSFEMRYACKGDYRDGKVVNDTTGQADAQLALNTKVWQAFYTWLVTSSDQQFVDELDLWCVRSAVAYFYAFTHYYTMIDNRAKNTFWHYAKTGVRRAVPIGRAFEGLMHIYEQDDGEGGYEPATSPFDNTKQYYTQYAFDMWAYDMDTAAGIDNNGELIFPYGKEDTDYREKDDPSSGPVFNGAGSVFWTRLRQNCSDSITAAFTGVSQECFNADNLIVEFDKVQNCYPEAIWRLDVERKYIRPFTGDTEAPDDNPYQSIALTRQNSRFLGDMMQGRKKYQRRQWIKNQDIYFGSKYMLSSVSGNQFDMVCYTIADQNVKPNWDVTITPYQDMYLNVDYGENAIRGRRAYAGIPMEIKCPFTSMNESRLRIYGADYIQALAGKAIREDENDPTSRIIGAESLASLYFRGNDFSHANKLRELVIGSPDPTYNNSQFTTLNISNRNPNLELLDIQNCGGLGGAIDLTQSTALKTVKAQGTSLTQVNLPSSTGIINLYLPTTITRLALIAAKNLTNLTIKARTAGSSDPNTPVALSELIINDSDYSSSINWMDIAKSALSHLTNLQLLGLSGHSSIQNINELDSFAERKNELGTFVNENGDTVARINLNGIINVTGDWSTIERDYYGGTEDSIWPALEFDTTGGTQRTKYKVTYRYDDYQDNEGQIVTGETIKILYVTDGDTAPDIYFNGTISTMPHRDSTVRESYEFGTIDNFSDAYISYSGWKLAGTATSLYDAGGAPIIRNDTVIETFFNTNARTYYVKWYTKEGVPSSLVKTSASPIRYGEGYNLEAPTVAEIHAAGQDTCSISISGGSATYSIFKGWKKLPTNITPTATDETYDIYGDWETGTVVIDDLFNENNLSNLTEVQLLVLSALDTNGKNTYNISNKIVEGTRITYPMGQDSIVPGTVLTPDNPLRLDGAQDQTYALDGSDNHPTIQPLKAGNDAFTLAIDYCFNPNVTYDKPFATLVSCFSSSYSINGTRTGIGLFYGSNIGDNRITGPRVGFGDMYGDGNQSVSIGTEATLGMRNIVVLRHPAGSNTLYIYSGLTNNNNLPSEVTVNTITWANYNTDAYLNFGKLTSETTDLSDGVLLNITNAKGTIFWSKYWNEDLGQGECKRLATWPHEQMTYAISRLNATSTSIARVSQTAVVTPSIYLSALSTPAHGRVVQSRAQGFTTFSGRDDSVIRTICNNRIFAALPTKLQAIMCQPNVAYTVVNNTSNSQETSYELAGTAVLGKDYVFQYSVANLINNSNSKYATLEDQYSHPFSWYNSANVVAYTYSASGTRWLVNNADSNATQYLNIRAPFKAIPWGTTNKLRVFREYVDRIPNDMTIVGTINDSDGAFPIRSGDIYITTNDKAYIYVTNSEIQTLGIQIMPTTGENAKFATPSEYRGGWIPIEGYWTRSAIAANGANFAYATQYGEPNITTVTNSSTEGFRLMYTIAI